MQTSLIGAGDIVYASKSSRERSSSSSRRRSSAEVGDVAYHGGGSPTSTRRGQPVVDIELMQPMMAPGSGGKAP